MTRGFLDFLIFWTITILLIFAAAKSLFFSSGFLQSSKPASFSDSSQKSSSFVAQKNTNESLPVSVVKSNPETIVQTSFQEDRSCRVVFKLTPSQTDIFDESGKKIFRHTPGVFLDPVFNFRTGEKKTVHFHSKGYHNQSMVFTPSGETEIHYIRLRSMHEEAGE